MRYCAVAALLGALLAAALPARAETVFVVGVENHAYLPAYTVENGQYGGFGRAVLDAFAAERGYRFDYRPLPVLRLFASFFAGELDLKFPDDAEWQPELRAGKPVLYSNPVADYIDGTSVPRDALGRPAEAIHALGTVTGFTPWPWQDRIAAGKVTLTENANFSALVQQALSGRIDAAYANIAVIAYQLDTVLKRPGTLAFDAALPFARGSYKLATMKHPGVIAEFNRWLVEHEGALRQMKDRFGVENGIRR